MVNILPPSSIGLYATNSYNGFNNGLGATNFSALGSTGLGYGASPYGGLGAAGLGGLGGMGAGAGLQQTMQVFTQAAKVFGDAVKQFVEAGGFKAAMKGGAGDQGGGEEESSAKWQEQGAQLT